MDLYISCCIQKRFSKSYAHFINVCLFISRNCIKSLLDLIKGAMHLFRLNLLKVLFLALLCATAHSAFCCVVPVCFLCISAAVTIPDDHPDDHDLLDKRD